MQRGKVCFSAILSQLPPPPSSQGKGYYTPRKTFLFDHEYMFLHICYLGMYVIGMHFIFCLTLIEKGCTWHTKSMCSKDDVHKSINIFYL
mmetsp:Transcript_2086/g.3190  ORF Transcript_2086/g.3190 Transcript_2086/m.3190 type:complete len:90 (+) Transcript_2086:3143-3412(+)